MTSENRKRSRVDMDLEAVLSCGGLEKYPVRVTNMSLKGVLCEPEPRVGRPDQCVLIFLLGGKISFRVDARMVRNDERGLALDFEEMDEKAFFHLRNLVRYHSGDPDAIDKELTTPAFKARKTQ